MRMRVVGGWRERAPWARERGLVVAAAARGDAGDAAAGDAEEEEEDVIGGGFGRSMYDEDDERVGSMMRGGYDVEEDEEDEEDEEVDYSGNASGGPFGDIDVIAGELELEDIERDVAVEKSRHFVDESGNLQGRALYVCRLNWWLRRVKNMQTYPGRRRRFTSWSSARGWSTTTFSRGTTNDATSSIPCPSRRRRITRLNALEAREARRTRRRGLCESVVDALHRRGYLLRRGRFDARIRHGRGT